MQIVHIGFWKTGTSGLRQLVFRQAGIPFLGEGSPNSDKSGHDTILRLIRGQKIAELEHLRRQPCILSHLSGPLLCGGFDGVGQLAKAISVGFVDPILLLTVREQESLLASAFFQSLRVRSLSIGVRDDSPICSESSCFISFGQWWRKLVARADVSLAGLLRYRALVERLGEGLPRDRIMLLPLEWLHKDPGCYRTCLLKLGLPTDAIDTFVSSPPLNSGENRPLRRERRGLGLLEKLLWQLEAYGAIEKRLARRLFRKVQNRIYRGKIQSAPRGYEAVCQEID